MPPFRCNAARLTCRSPLATLLLMLLTANVVLASDARTTLFPKDGVPKKREDLAALQSRIQSVVKTARECTVSFLGGSGVIVSRDGYVMTVAHVTNEAGRTVAVQLPDGRRVMAKTLGNDRGVDAGLMKITDEGPFPFVEMAKSSELKRGQWCVAAGYPVSYERGKPAVVRIGRVAWHNPQVVVTDCTIMGGDSGGPLLDLDGKLIAIGTRCDNTVHINMHVPVDHYRKYWDRLVDGEDFDSLSPTRTFLGIAPDREANEPRVGYVFQGSAAEQAGMQVGDVVLKFNGIAIGRFEQLPPLVKRKKPGDEVELVFRRGQRQMTVKVKLGEREKD
jgi:serine protease Do